MEPDRSKIGRLTIRPGQTGEVFSSLVLRYTRQWLVRQVKPALAKPPRVSKPVERRTMSEAGTPRITVRWPLTACHLLEAAKPRFEQIACSFTTFNPQLAMRALGRGRTPMTYIGRDPYYKVESLRRWITEQARSDDEPNPARRRTGRPRRVV
jgi:hypothetical protein